MAKRTSEATRPDGVVVAPACALVIFGAAGDLTHRLLMPALYNLRRTGLLSPDFAILAVDRADSSAAFLKESMGKAINEFAHTRGTGAVEFDEAAWGALAEAIEYQQGDLTDPKTYQAIGTWLDATEKRLKSNGNALFYLAVADRFFGPVVDHLSEAGLTDQDGGARWRRVIIEKPFGHDLKSATELNRQILSHLGEDQVYRIDHYLGKETVQNIMVFRFANGFFEPVWNRDHIDHIQITVAETVGVEHRASFYERTGALRDMVPNHLFQLLSMIAMEPPNNFSADAVRTEKVKVLDAAHLAGFDTTARGQYDDGKIGGKKHVGYRAEPDVDPHSSVETYVAFKLLIDNWRWGGMPFYLRTGKALAQRRSQIVVQFKRAPFVLFRNTPVDRMPANRLIIDVQPDEGVSLEFGVKIPGPAVDISHVSMRFRYQDYFDTPPATGYETLIYDCMIGDATLFQRADAVEAGWRVVQPLLDHWADEESGPQLYPAGGNGPANADDMLAADGRRWHPFSEV